MIPPMASGQMSFQGKQFETSPGASSDGFAEKYVASDSSQIPAVTTLSANQNLRDDPAGWTDGPSWPNFWRQIHRLRCSLAANGPAKGACDISGIGI